MTKKRREIKLRREGTRQKGNVYWREEREKKQGSERGTSDKVNRDRKERYYSKRVEAIGGEREARDRQMREKRGTKD